MAKNTGGALIGAGSIRELDGSRRRNPTKEALKEVGKAKAATAGTVMGGAVLVELLAQFVLPPEWRMGFVGAAVRTAGGFLLGAGATHMEWSKPYAERLEHGGLAAAGIMFAAERVFPALPARGSLTTTDAIETFLRDAQDKLLKSAAPDSAEAKSLLALQNARRALLAAAPLSPQTSSSSPASSGETPTGEVFSLPAPAGTRSEGLFLKTPPEPPSVLATLRRNGVSPRWGQRGKATD